MCKDCKDYNATLNLPKTDFPMRAGLPKSEPVMLQNWETERVYDKLMEINEGKPLFVLHDGPPYANGDIHLGHALNKLLKDFIVRQKNMAGYKAPFVPGWDTHGLPTELKARQKAGIGSSADISVVELRKLCEEFVTGYINDQREQFKRLGCIGEWDNPYITLKHEFEEEQIKVFAEMADKGYIYRGLKPVYWCPECKTALAEAEIEYAEDPCHSIYVKFRVTDDLGKFAAMGIDPKKVSFVIWTTTTWTLPANVAICVGPRYDYSVIKSGDIDSNGFVVHLPFVARVLYSLRDSDYRRRYDVIIVITQQRYVRYSSDTSPEHYRDGSGVISLEGWEDSEIEMVASLMLEHIMGHMFFHDGLPIHCECPTCTMSNLASRTNVLNLIKRRSATGLDHFCSECRQWIRVSSLWSDQPSEVVRGERF